MVVRSDKGLDASFRKSKAWGSKQLGPRSLNLAALTRGGGNDSGRSSHSFSGNERNHLFLNDGGKTFCDVSGISALDSPKDTRSFVVWDYDRDGWQDIVFCNANAPLLNVYRNVMGEETGAAERGFVAVKLVGGNREAKASKSYSPRDGFGARVTVGLGGQGELEVVREHRAGEGFAAQNSSVLVIGIGARDQARDVTIRWPSGLEQTARDVAAGTLLVAFEDPSETPDGTGFARSIYGNGPVSKEPVSNGTGERGGFELRLSGKSDAPAGEMNLYVTMATWCAACKRNLPQVAELRESFPAGELDLVGVPLDPEEGDDLLDTYVTEHAPAYRLLRGLRPEDRAKVREILLSTIRTDGLPSSIVTDSKGRVLEAFPGLPSVSDVRRLRDVALRFPGE